MRWSAIPTGRRSDNRNYLESGEIRVICGWLIFFNAAFERRGLAGIKAGRRDEKYIMGNLSSYAVKFAIHAIDVKNIPVFPIHEMRAEGGGNDENCNLR